MIPQAEEIPSLFPVPDREVYFNTAGMALCPEPVARDVKSFLDRLTRDPIGAHREYHPRAHNLRGNLARLLGAAENEVAVTHHTAEGTGIIANGLDWREGDAVMTLDHEYPSTVYPWMQLERTRGVRLVMLEEKDGRVDEAEIVEAIRRVRPRLFAVSAVEWNSGYRFDLETIGKVCAEEGVFFFVDAAQALGFTEVDVKQCGVSAVAGSAWKWLFGPAGQGYLFLRRDLLERIRPVFVGSESVEDPQRYLPYHFTLRGDMRRFEYSTSNLSALVWFEAGVRFTLDLGLENIREHVFALQDYTFERLSELGCRFRGEQGPEHRSGIMAFQHPRLDSADLAKRLAREGIIARARDGFVRLAFHVYNTRAGMDRLVDFLRRQ